MANAEDLDRVYKYHRPTVAQAEKYGLIRAAGRSLAERIVKSCPASPERTTALRRVQEAVMWANASIALNEPDADDDLEV